MSQLINPEDYSLKELLAKVIEGQQSAASTLAIPTKVTGIASLPRFLLVAISGASTATPISANTLYVRYALISNTTGNPVSIGDNTVTTSSNLALSSAASATAASLNRLEINPGFYFDLSQIYFVQTGTGLTLAVLYFQ